MEVVGELRAAGMSTRAIGDAVGVDPQTVLNDLGRVENSTPVAVVGLDGKTYPTKADDAAFADRVKRLDPDRVRALLADVDDPDDDLSPVVIVGPAASGR